MALHQLFTLAFALHLEPLPTLDYAAVPYVKDPAHSSESLHETDNLRVGANTKLEPIHTRHLPHSLDTLSFLLNHTRAVDAVEPFAKLIELLDDADDDPEFRNLREFFDARYNQDGSLTGADKEPRRRIRSVSRAASTKQPGRRPSQATDARKSSFATSLGGASALKLSWLRRGNNPGSQNHDASDDEDSHSRVSSSGHAAHPPPPTAPYIRLAKPKPSSSPASSTSSSSHRDSESSKTITFRIRLDLHAVGLAPPPPKPRSHRHSDASALSLQRTSSAKSATSSDWRRRRPRNSSLSSGGAALRPVTSPDSLASFGAVSSIANGLSDQQLASISTAQDAQTATKRGLSLPPEGIDNNLPSITEGTVSSPTQLTGHSESVSPTTPQQPASPTTPTKPARRPSMMAKILEFGRKKSFLDRSTGDAHDDPADSKAGAHASDAVTRRSSFRSGFRQQSANQTPCNEEAIDLGEYDDDAALRAQMMHNSANGTSAQGRRRSSAGSSTRDAAFLRHTPHDLRPVQEGGMLDLTTVSSRSSIGTSLSDHAIPEDSATGTLSAERTSKSPSRTRQAAALNEGHDFLSLFRAASILGLKSIDDDDDVPSTTTPNGDDLATPGRDGAELRSPRPTPTQAGETSSTHSPSIRTPQVHPKRTSLPGTPGRSVRSLDLDRSPRPPSSGTNPIDANFKLGASLANKSGGDEDEAWWPCGDVDPLPISISSALGQALGWEGIMHLCYGKGSRAEEDGKYVALGKAAALDQATKVQERNVLAWRTGVASAGTSPPKPEAPMSIHELGVADAAALDGNFAQRLNLDPAHALPDTTKTSAVLERLQAKTPQRSTTEPSAAATEWQQASLLFGTRVNHARTWEHWRLLFKSIKGWMDEYEKTRVRSGLAREIGLDRPVDAPAREEDGDASVLLAAPIDIEGGSELHVPVVGSPPSHAHVLKLARDKVDVSTISRVLGTSLSVPPCVLADATNRAHGFRRRTGIPEGLPLGPGDEEAIEYTWSRKQLSVEHFATALTISTDSALHYFAQLSVGNSLHRSAWELDYLEMCVFKSPLVADRFPPPGEAVVEASQSYRAREGEEDRSRLCPNPDERGAWDPDTWKTWLAGIREGDIIVPAVAWQAWWTLISVLNGADRSGRAYDLQVKTKDEPFEALTDLNAVYL